MSSRCGNYAQPINRRLVPLILKFLDKALRRGFVVLEEIRRVDAGGDGHYLLQQLHELLDAQPREVPASYFWVVDIFGEFRMRRKQCNFMQLCKALVQTGYSRADCKAPELPAVDIDVGHANGV